MRSIQFSFRNVALACVATAAIAAGACSDSTSPTASVSDIVYMRFRIGNQRSDYFFKPGTENAAANVAVLSGIGVPVTPFDTVIDVAWLKKDSTIDENLKPAAGWKAYVDTVAAANASGKLANGQPILVISPRSRFDAYGFNIRANAALPAGGINVDFYLLNPNKEKVLGPVTVNIRTP
jgi:hypothetical protein